MLYSSEISPTKCNNCVCCIFLDLFHYYLVGCLYYLYQWRTVKQISDNEIYLLFKYIKSVLWRVAKRLSYMQDARYLKVNSNPKPIIQPSLTCQILQVQSATLSSERLADGLALVPKIGEGGALGWVCWFVRYFFFPCWEDKLCSRQSGFIIIHQFIVLLFHTPVTYFGAVTSEKLSARDQYVSTTGWHKKTGTSEKPNKN